VGARLRALEKQVDNLQRHTASKTELQHLASRIEELQASIETRVEHRLEKVEQVYNYLQLVAPFAFTGFALSTVAVYLVRRG